MAVVLVEGRVEEVLTYDLNQHVLQQQMLGAMEQRPIDDAGGNTPSTLSEHGLQVGGLRLSEERFPSAPQGIYQNPHASSSTAAAALSGDHTEREGDDMEFVVGPTDNAFLLGLAGAFSKPPMVKSSSRALHLSDIRRLADFRPRAPLSFGSLNHFLSDGTGRNDQLCRACMFERTPGRCKRGFLCDFCHLDTRRHLEYSRKFG
eukprot:TRINITY_DN123736_c0_g1_i1.p1 TRINITY_DN123736_c0_g1~~TRINITY_DN123736_c0_g1_i1.p1  ORF type:complete len:204 (-),score=25.15 TRINITY_DN123736_c0_g1_i1:240-851(-)